VTGPVGRYGLVFRPAALRALRKLDRQIAERIKTATEALRDDPRPPGAKMLTGSHSLWRIRVGDYRIVYTIDDQRNVVRVAAVGHRRDVDSR
jgi:mRNA interferase RelE/StbE